MTNKEFRKAIKDSEEIPDFYTLLFAEDFLDLLPEYLKDFEVVVDDDGEITFDWIDTEKNYLSITINYSNELIYACVGHDRCHGKISLGETIPEELLRLIKLYSKGTE